MSDDLDSILARMWRGVRDWAREEARLEIIHQFGSNVRGGKLSGGAIGGSQSIPPATLPLATTSTVGAVKPDGSTITITGGVLTSHGSGVTSVAMTVPGFLSVSGSPITTTGTLAVSLATQTKNTVFAGPTSGSAATPTFRVLGTADLPASARSPWINVLDYGAKGDGSTDDTTAITNAIAAVPSTGGTVYFPNTSSYYKVTSTISVPGNMVSLLGDGDEWGASTIKMVTANTILFEWLSTTPFSFGTIRNLHLQGPGATIGQTSSKGVYADYGVNMENCQVEGFCDGLYWDQHTYYCHVTNCNFYNNTRWCIRGDGVNNCTISTCRINGQTPSHTLYYGQTGVQFHGVNNCRIVDCAVEGFGQSAIEIDGNSATNPYSLACTIGHCYFELNGTYGDIVLGPLDLCYGIVIENCLFVADTIWTGSWCIQGNHLSYLTIIGCVIGSGTGTAKSGVYGGANASKYVLINYQNPLSLTMILPANSYTLDPTNPPGTGSVTSVAASVPAEFSLSGSPITTSGTLAITKATQTANTLWAGPTSGSAAAPTFRAIVSADIPAGFATAIAMQSGSSAPPVPLWTSTGDDYVYLSRP